MLYRLGTHTPELRGMQHFIADSASVVGNVVLENNVSIWFSAVLRGDIEQIYVGENTNVQDGAVLHTDNDAPLHVGANVTVGHQATLHGCTVGEGSLIAIQAVLLNRCVIGKNCLIGAGALIPEGKVIPDGVLVLGSPGKVIRPLTEVEIAAMHANTARYVQGVGRYLRDLAPL